MHSYAEGLSPSEKKEYLTKTEKIKYNDPYKIKSSEFSSDVENFPNVTSLDMVNYFVLSPNPSFSASEMLQLKKLTSTTSPTYTKEEMKAFKSLDAHNQFVSGWVRDVRMALVEDHVIIRAKVSVLAVRIITVF